jgi:hypothetical protein
MREIPKTNDRGVDPEFHRNEKERAEHREKSKNIANRKLDEELDERDEDMVDDIVDILYSRKYGDENKTLR